MQVTVMLSQPAGSPGNAAGAWSTLTVPSDGAVPTVEKVRSSPFGSLPVKAIVSDEDCTGFAITRTLAVLMTQVGLQSSYSKLSLPVTPVSGV